MTIIDHITAAALRHVRTTYSPIPRFQILTVDRPMDTVPIVFEPAVCLVLQGVKQTCIGSRILRYGRGECLVVGAEVAALVQIRDASPERPCVALNLNLDPALVAALLVDMENIPQPAMTPGFGVNHAAPELLDTWRRLVGMLDRPHEIPVLGPQLERELMFRLLTSAHGEVLRQIAGIDSRLTHVRKAMAWIRQHYAEHLTVEAMAAVAGMSVSVFHRRFKEVAALSPLQYQKHIRLHEARRQIAQHNARAETIAFSVGYESASQFSREYKRLFGKPPAEDAKIFRMLSDIDSRAMQQNDHHVVT